MRIWLITSGEPTTSGSRLMRTGMLAAELTKRGHEILWWTTSFDHRTKQYISESERKNACFAGYRLYHLHSRIRYKKNVGLARILNHHGVAVHFRMSAAIHPKPDLVVCSYPTIDLAAEAVKFGRKAQVPVIIDVRDLWPDIFGAAVPRVFRKIGLDRLLLTPWNMAKRKIFEEATAITSVSPRYLSWALGCAKNRTWRSTETGVFPLAISGRNVSIGNQNNGSIIRQSLGIGITDIVVWFSGTFGTTYDLIPVIDAARYFASRGERIRFVFSGDGEMRNAWELAARGLSNVIFTGWLDAEGLARVGSIANIGLLAYREGAPQGYPNKLFEYLSLGLPIVSSLQGETREFLEQETIGVYYNAISSAELVRAVDVLRADKSKMYDMGQRALVAFNGRFAADAVYGKFADFVETLSVAVQEDTRIITG